MKKTAFPGRTIVKFRSIHSLSILALMACLAMPVFVDAGTASAQGEPSADLQLPEPDRRPYLTPRNSDDAEESRIRVPRGKQVTAHDLDFRLVGTVVADDPRRSLAVVENASTGEQRGYVVGDQVGKILIKEILYGKVVIRTAFGDAVVSVNSWGRGDASITPDEEAPPRMAHVDKQELDSALPDYTQLVREIRMRPRFEAGHPKGFVIYNIAPKSLLGRMGLKDGDVIVGVNDTPFSTTQPVVEFYEALKAGETVSFIVERDEVIQDLRIEFTE